MTDVARTTAYETILRIEQDGAFSNIARDGLRKLDRLDAAFAETIVLGVLERRRALDYLIGRYASRTPSAPVQSLLRMGVLQIAWMDRVPDSAACNETVKIAKKKFGDRTANFVNAVLRSLCREKEVALSDLEMQLAEVRFSVSDGIGSLLRAQYPEEAERIMESFGFRQPLHARVNRLKADQQVLAEALDATLNGERLTVTEKHAELVREAENGNVLIQGYGSQQAVALLGAKAGETVLDVCACPGGKSFGAALDMQNNGHVISMDLHANKLSLIQKGAKRLGITIIQTKAHDARTADEAWIGKADRVICDVPCSGLGVIGAKPEIRYKDPEEFKGLYQTQKQILSASASYVRNGGVLVYSTCTINKAENEEIVRAFVQEYPMFVLTEAHTYLPFSEAGEGFYVARMEKRPG